jgi:hypothetical protein
MIVKRFRDVSLALPDCHYLPTAFFEFSSHSFVASNIAFEFFGPELDPRLRRISELASGMPVPEAPVDEDDCLVSRENNVWPARKIAPVQPKAIAELVKRTSDSQFRLRVPRSDAGHHRASLRIDRCIFDHLRTEPHSRLRQAAAREAESKRPDLGPGR